MRLFRQRTMTPGASANEIATHAVTHSDGGRVAAVISAVALVFSAYSLWETSLKQAELNVYVTGKVSYGRDLSEDKSVRPPGGFEVLAVPVTIANSGARDATVLSLEIEAKNPETSRSARLDATYTADAGYFVKSRSGERPKTPFSALVIAGRSAWSGTILFYSAHEGEPDWSENRDFREDTVIRAKMKDRVDVTLKVLTPPPGSWLDRVLGSPVLPITLGLEVPNASLNALSNGDLVRLRSVAAKS